MNEARKTYTERRTYSARVMRWRRTVYARREGMTAGCRVLLLRLSDDMDSKCIVSIPRSVLAADLDVAPARITEWVKLGKALGFLSTVKRAQPGTTAVYQGIRPTPEVRQDVPREQGESGTSEVRKTGHHSEVRQDVPLSDVLRYARAVPQEGTRLAPVEQAEIQDLGDEERSKERGCYYCTDSTCDGECLEQQSEEAATTDSRRFSA